MTDIDKVGNIVKKTNKDSNFTYTRDSTFGPIITRVRDIFDSTNAYEMDFETFEKGRIFLDLTFRDLPKGKCCVDCFCTVCEVFTDNVQHEIELQFPYLEGSVHVFKNLSLKTDFTETSPQSKRITLGFSFITTDKIRVCYLYKYTNNCTGNPTG